MEKKVIEVILKEAIDETDLRWKISRYVFEGRTDFLSLAGRKELSGENLD